MTWYLSKLVFRILCGDGRHTPQFDEQLRLVLAKDEKEAFEKSVQLGTREEDRFFNQKQQLVEWQFVNVAELYPLQELADGVELYSRIREVDNAGTYMDFIHRKAASIQEQPVFAI